MRGLRKTTRGGGRRTTGQRGGGEEDPVQVGGLRTRRALLKIASCPYIGKVR